MLLQSTKAVLNLYAFFAVAATELLGYTMDAPLQPLCTTYNFTREFYGCVTHLVGGTLETVVLDASAGVPLRGACKHEGLAFGQRQPMKWDLGGQASAEHEHFPRFASPVWDPFSGSVFGITYGGHAVAQLLPDNTAVIIAGHISQAGAQEGFGASARFSWPSSISPDGKGNLYIIDRNHLWKLTLPSSWQHEVRALGTPSGSYATTAAEGAQAGAHGRRTHHAAQPPDQALAKTLVSWEAVERCHTVVYDSVSQALVLAGVTAVYRRPLVEGAGEQTVLAAGHATESSYRDGMGAEARFRSISDIVVDGQGFVLVADYDEEVDLTALRRVAPDGAVTTVVEDLQGGFYCPAILPNGYLALCDDRPEEDLGEPGNPRPPQLLVIDLGLPLPACHAAARPPQPAPGAKPHSLPADLSALLASLSQPDGSSADVVVEAGGRDFPAHRAVLAARSAFFRSLVDPSRGFTDGTAQRLSLPDADPKAFELVLRYMYTDSVGSIPEALLPLTAELADRLLLPGLCEEVGRQVLECVCGESVVGLLLWAEQHRATYGELLRGLKEWFVEHKAEMLRLPVHTKRLMTENADLAFELLCDGVEVAAKRQRLQ